jgi:DNA-binding transcriptional ArsR family regulator
MMHAFDVLGDPVRRRILEILAEDRLASGEIVAIVGREFGITQSAVSQHLKVLREAGLVGDRPAGTRRVHYIDPKGLAALRAWLDQFWDQALAAFEAEVEKDNPARGGEGK